MTWTAAQNHTHPNEERGTYERKAIIDPALYFTFRESARKLFWQASGFLIGITLRIGAVRFNDAHCLSQEGRDESPVRRNCNAALHEVEILGPMSDATLLPTIKDDTLKHLRLITRVLFFRSTEPLPRFGVSSLSRIVKQLSNLVNNYSQYSIDIEEVSRRGTEVTNHMYLLQFIYRDY
ncbi:hypothetical protein B0H34DRAFT_677069 [Crassisporium funariophilum]|nr:hypothetical protein B0H34DRAFT_677069 [Crassisporium funariophilum]